MKLAFLDTCQYEQGKNENYAPMAFAYMASSLEKYLDFPLDISIEVDTTHLLKQKPDIVGIAAYSEHFDLAQAAAVRIKHEANVPVIIGGKHITALPGNMKGCFDVGVIGDGERTMVDLMALYRQKQKFLPEDLAKIDGIVFQDQGLQITSSRPALRELDDLPPPKRSVLHAYWPSYGKEIYWPQGVFSSRGCPYKCPFCIHSKLQFVTRFHSPARFVEEVKEMIYTYNYNYITIHDDLFTLKKARVKAISDLIVSEKLHKKATFACLSKSNLFDEETAYWLRRMNIKAILFGFESGDEEVLRYLKKDSSKLSQNINAINICNKYGIHCGGFFILGSPPETKEAMLNTYWFIRQNMPPIGLAAGIFSYTPLPGTKAWDMALAKGLVAEEGEDWDKYSTRFSYDGFFLNEHYSYRFFHDVFDQHFKPLMEKNQAIQRHHQDNARYYEKITELLQEIKLDAGVEVLEVFNKYLNSISENWLPGQKNVCLNHWQGETINDESYDVIILNHCLEQMKRPLAYFRKLWQNNLNKQGKMVIVVKNNQFIGNLINLLYNHWDNSIIGFREFDLLYQLNSKQLCQALESLSSHLQIVPLGRDIGQELLQLKPLLPLLQTYVPESEFEKLRTFSFLIIATK